MDDLNITNCKKNILFVNPGKLTSITDNISYINYLEKDYNLYYFGIKEGDEYIDNLNVNIKYIQKHNNYFKNKILFILNLRKHILKNNFNFIFINYFFGCFIVKLILPTYRIHLDIRTGHISDNIIRNKIFNKMILFESFFFNSVSVISESLAKYLDLNRSSYLLPLGANKIITHDKTYNNLNLLYVGNLKNRNIHITIKGIRNFIDTFQINDIFYTIIAFGNEDEVMEIRNLINKLNLNDKISFLGEIRPPELYNYFDSSNIGVSFIPITNYFNYQPATKTYEYLINGMPVIATSTHENMKIINDKNGVLINDDVNSFAEGLYILYRNRKQYNFNNITYLSSIYSWENVLKNYLVPIINGNNEQ